VWYTIIDPMHNLLLGMLRFIVNVYNLKLALGVAKTQWYNQWIVHKALHQSTDIRPRELDMIHLFLGTVCSK